MELSLFLAKFLGLYLMVLSALCALRMKVFEEVKESFLAQRALIFFSGLIALAVGIAIVVSHSVWEPGWRCAITVIGYVSVAKGIIRIAFPDQLGKIARGALSGSPKWVLFGSAFAFGAWLAWMGFTGG